YIGGNVSMWASRRHLHFGPEARVWLGSLVLAAFALTFVATAVLVALRTRERALLVATVTAMAPVTLTGLLLIPLGVFWLPGLYQIDYELHAFVIENVTGTLLFAPWVALAAAVVAGCTLALRRRTLTS
ncbi:MAG TPA: hypothetical protein VLK84_29665, partial [Longimicrobium sp.]|nr:hypothetical protein [Longimicrobium sp.]